MLCTIREAAVWIESRANGRGHLGPRFAQDFAQPDSLLRRQQALALVLRPLEVRPVRISSCSRDRQAIKIETIALDVIARSHILQSTGNGRIDSKPAGLIEPGQPLLKECRPIDRHTLRIVALDEPPAKLNLSIGPRWCGTHSDLIKRTEMCTLSRLLVVLVSQVSLEISSCGDEVVGEWKPRPLSCESKGEVSQLDICPSARNPRPPRGQRLFDGHDAVEVGNKTFIRDIGNIGKPGSLEPTDLFDPNLVHLDQGSDLDEWSKAAATNDIAGLAEHHNTTHTVQHGCGPWLEGFSVCLQRVGHLNGSRTMRT